MVKNLKDRIQRLTAKVEHLCETSSTPVSNDLHITLTDIMAEYGPQVEHLPASNMKRIFWEQQVNCACPYRKYYIRTKTNLLLT